MPDFNNYKTRPKGKKKKVCSDKGVIRLGYAQILELSNRELKITMIIKALREKWATDKNRWANISRETETL